MKGMGTTAIALSIKCVRNGRTSEFRSEWDASNDPEDLGPMAGSMLAQAIMSMRPSRRVLLLAEVVESLSENAELDNSDNYYAPWATVENEFVSAAYRVVEYWDNFDRKASIKERQA